MEIPKSKSIASLLRNHPDFNAGRMELIRAYYDGGDDFPIATELRKKGIELSNDECAVVVRKARQGCAYYTNYFGDTISDLVATICNEGIEIKDDENRSYWRNIGSNIDGSQGTATAETRSAATDDFNYNRAFYLVKFPDPKSTSSNLAASLAAGDLDGQIIALDAGIVTSWKIQDDGSLEWARTYEMELIGDDYETELHTWTFYTDDGIVVYTAEKPVSQQYWTGQNADGSFRDDSAQATLDDEETSSHQLKRCPVFKIRRKLKAAVGEKLLPTARQLFNEESDASYLKFMILTGGLFVFTDNPNMWKSGITLSPQAAIIAGKEDKIQRDSVEPGMFAALDSACAERRGQLGGLIHTMARQSAAQSASGQNTSRNTGAALKQQNDPMNAWLRGFAEPHLACWREMLNVIADVRGDDISDLEISGLMPSDEDDSPPDMLEATAFLALPRVPDAQKDAYACALGYEMCEDVGVDDETLNKISDSKAADVVNLEVNNKVNISESKTPTMSLDAKLDAAKSAEVNV